jgi:DNA repair protein RadC
MACIRAPEEATMFVPRHGSDAAATGPRLRKITVQYRLTRGVDGRPIHLGSPITHSWAAAQLLAQVLAHEAVEVFGVLCLNTRGRVLGWHEISRGALDGVWIHARDVFRTALISNAASVILAHNHPSGEADPSPDDLQMTKRLTDVGTRLGVPIVDHIIVGDREFASLRTAPSELFAGRLVASTSPPLDGGIVCTKGRLLEHFARGGESRAGVQRNANDEAGVGLS